MIFRASRRRLRGAGASSRQFVNGVSKPPRERTVRWLLILGAYVVLVAAMTKHLAPQKGAREYEAKAGTFAPETINAEFAFESIDQQATRAAEEAAAAKVPHTYRVDREAVQRNLRSFEERISALGRHRQGLTEHLRKSVLASNSDTPEKTVIWDAVKSYAAKIISEDPAFAALSDPSLLAVWIVPTQDSVPRRLFDTRSGGQTKPDKPLPTKGLEEAKSKTLEFAYANMLSRLGREALTYTLTYGVLPVAEAPLAQPGQGPRRIVVLRDRLVGDLKTSEEFGAAEVPVRTKARQVLYAYLVDAAQSAPEANAGVPVERDRLLEAVCEMAALDLGDTLVFDPVVTEGARETARTQVKPVTKTIQKNQAIQAGGTPWTEQSLADYRTYLSIRRSGDKAAGTLQEALAAHAILAALALVCLMRWLVLFRAPSQDARQYLPAALLVMCTTLVVGRAVWYFDPSGFATPLAAGAMLLAILTNARIAAMTSLLTAGLMSAQFDYSWRLLMVSSAMALGGIFSISSVRRRSDMGRAAVKAAGAGILVALAVTLATDSLVSRGSIQRLELIGLNGLACLFIVPGLLSPLERLFGITTDIQLLEYSDLNNEVLSRLAIEIPATHAHSLRLGELAEAAARAVGANGLLARVCAYYHDIGKLRRPEYFSENQTGVNIHDQLAPRLSARAVASHVHDGAEIAREHHLPKPIVDGIMEHHGTTLISFFHQKALAQQKHGDVREEDFRYPGPKPQRRETAILMICDAVESGVRSIKHLNEERVREFTDKVIKSRAADGQLDKCDLTLRDLDTIREVVTRCVLTGLHHRVAYPERPPLDRAANVIHMTGGRDA